MEEKVFETNNEIILDKTDDILRNINWDVFKVVFMFGLIIIMIVLSLVIWKYGSAIKTDPCNFCDCSKQIIYNAIR